MGQKNFFADYWFLAQDEKAGSEFWDLLVWREEMSDVFRRIEVRVPLANRKEGVVSHPTLDLYDYFRLFTLPMDQGGAPPR
jgi:hypothetical protein